jgi:hypothetical protein
LVLFLPKQAGCNKRLRAAADLLRPYRRRSYMPDALVDVQTPAGH